MASFTSMPSLLTSPALTPSRAFHKYDAAHKGYLVEVEFRCALAYLHGVAPSQEEAEACFTYARRRFEKESPGLEFRGISLTTFKKIADLREEGIEKKLDNVTELFEIMDRNHKGFISIDDWKQAIRECAGPRLAARECQLLDLFFEIDSNRDGKVSLKDFQQLLHFQN